MYFSKRSLGALFKKDSEEQDNGSDFKDAMETIVEKLDKEELEDMATVLWRIWKRMNDFVFKVVFTHPSTLVKQSTQLLQNIKELDYKVTNKAKTSIKQNGCWEAPPMDIFKIN